MPRLMTTREAAAFLGVGTSSVKRWADDGVLTCVKTPGGHRRFPRTEVEAMLRDRTGSDEAVTDQLADEWLDLLVRGTSPHEVYRRLSDERDHLGSWWQVSEVIAGVLVEIGEQWASGKISVLQEHLASERLGRGLARCAEDIAPPADAPSALLIAAEGDEHTLGLSLAELVLREAGLITRWTGRRTPRPALASFLGEGRIRLVVVTAAASSSDRRALAEYASWLGQLCADNGSALVLGGAGAWPESPAGGHRFNSFAELARFGASLT